MTIKCDGLIAQGEALPKISHQPTELQSCYHRYNDCESVMSPKSHLLEGEVMGNKSGGKEVISKNKQGDHCGVASHSSLLAATNDKSNSTKILAPIVAPENNIHQAVCQTTIHYQLALCVVPFEQTHVQQLDALQRIEDARQCDDGLTRLNHKLAVARIIAGGNDDKA